MHKKKSLMKIIFTVLFLMSCNREYTPKPRGFFRIDLPEKKYQKSDLNCPFIFEHGKYAEIENYPMRKLKPFLYL